MGGAGAAIAAAPIASKLAGDSVLGSILGSTAAGAGSGAGAGGLAGGLSQMLGDSLLGGLAGSFDKKKAPVINPIEQMKQSEFDLGVLGQALNPLFKKNLNFNALKTEGE